jgi:CxxC-x17-CxxC domain-containing protein
MYEATCSNCGQETQVPFRPTEGRPVYCRDCFAERGGGDRGPRGGSRGGGGYGGGRGGGRGGERELHDATCANCGTATQVPFRPTEGRPVYCRDCFAEMKDRR